MFELNIVAVFDGISAGRVGINKTLASNRHIRLGQYMRSEIDKFADKVAQHHFPEDVQLGDVTKWREWNIDWSNIDIFIGGSPCQGFSFAGKQAGTKAILDGVEVLVTDREIYLEMKGKGAEFLSQSHLFWEYVLILDHVKKHNPNVRFLLENVKMKKELLAMIDDALGVESIVINSNLLSAQNRHRHYWHNWSVSQPVDKGILLRDVLEHHVSDFINPESLGRYVSPKGLPKGLCKSEGKSKCLTASSYKGYGNDGVSIVESELSCQAYNRNEGLGKSLIKAYPLCSSDFRGLNRNQNQTAVVTKLRPCTRIQPGDSGHIANASDINGHDILKRVYGCGGKAPTMNSCGGGNREPKVAIFQKPRGKNLGGLHEEKSPTVTANSFEQNHLVIGGAIRGRYDEQGKVFQKLETNGLEKSNCLTTVQKDNVVVRATVQANAEHTYNQKSPTLTSAMGMGGGNVPMCSDHITAQKFKGRYINTQERMYYRKLTPIECERLQTFPDNYTSMVSNSQRYKSLGNSWTVDVISHIFDEMILDMELSGYFSE